VERSDISKEKMISLLIDFAARDTPEVASIRIFQFPNLQSCSLPYRHPSDGEKERFDFVRLMGPMVHTKAVSL
jgi:hypothetical protein